MRLFILFFFILISSCGAQHSVATNKIFEEARNKVGVKSSAGKILIKPDYLRIIPIHKHNRLVLPPRSEHRILEPEPLEYYQVYNEARELAIFDTDGKLVFDFCNCLGFQIDEHTQTIVAKSKAKGKRARNRIYTIKGKALFEESFQEIGYINDSDLIALIKEDGANEEFYLYNPFTKKRIGPYDHFNIYNKDFDPTMGIKTIKFEKLINPIGISVRQKDTWGVVDMQGNEVYPMVFESFRFLPNEMQETFIKLSEKPENVEFMFYARLKSNYSQLLFFDKQLKKYSFTRLDSGKTKIELLEE